MTHETKRSAPVKCSLTFEPTDDYPHGVWACRRCGLIVSVPYDPPECSQIDVRNG